MYGFSTARRVGFVLVTAVIFVPLTFGGTVYAILVLTSTHWALVCATVLATAVPFLRAAGEDFWAPPLDRLDALIAAARRKKQDDWS